MLIVKEMLKLLIYQWFSNQKLFANLLDENIWLYNILKCKKVKKNTSERTSSILFSFEFHLLHCFKICNTISSFTTLLFGSVPFARNMYYLLNLLRNFNPNNSNMLKPINGNLFSYQIFFSDNWVNWPSYSIFLILIF